jgi:putative transposase
MTTVKMAFKYRAYPSKSQQKFLDECIHSCWWFYRYVLHNYEDDYKSAKKNYQEQVLSYYDLNIAYHPNWFRREPGKVKIPKEFYPLGAPIRHQGKGELSTYKLLQRARADRIHLQNVPAIVMQEVLERVAHAFDKFWKEGGGYPNYPKERNYSSVTWTGTGNVKLYKDEQLLKLSGFPGLLKIVYHRPAQGTIKRANVSMDSLGRYYVSLMCEFESVEKPNGEDIVGIDMNIKAIDETSRSFIALSNGEKVDIPRWYTQSQEQLAKIQRKIAKVQIGSERWRKYNRHLKHLYEDVDNKKKEWLHQLTHRLSSEFGYVVIEDLTLTGFHKKKKRSEEVDNMVLAADRGVRKAWTETPFGEFVRQLDYKMGNRLVRVNPAYTSKKCNVCGKINGYLTLSDREWVCPCGAHLDRDINAAINIRNDGIVFINESIKRQEEKKE